MTGQRRTLDQRLDSVGALTANVFHELGRATAADAADGVGWYDRAESIARELTPGNVRTGAGILAALSPQCSWRENVARARRTVDVGTAAGLTFGNATAKADAILGGADPLDVLGGPKVRAFFACIVGEDSTVCVDRHALDIARGYPSDDKGRKVLDLVGAYDRVASAYVHVGQLVGARPCDVQAVTWTSWRRRKGLDWAD